MSKRDPHSVDIDHPCIACGQVNSHDHPAGTLDRALKGEPLQPWQREFLDEAISVDASGRFHARRLVMRTPRRH